MTSSNPEPLLEAASEIRRAANRLTRRLRTERSADALSTNKLAVLSHLYRNGPTTPGRIATVEHQRPQSLTRVFAELERDGLIVRMHSEQDRRQSVLELTMTGLRTLAGDMAERDAWLAAALGELSETERQVLRIAAGIMDRLAEVDVTAEVTGAGEGEAAGATETEPGAEAVPERVPDSGARVAETEPDSGDAAATEGEGGPHGSRELR